jgi:arylsulfatase A-like enzyme
VPSPLPTLVAITRSKLAHREPSPRRPAGLRLAIAALGVATLASCGAPAGPPRPNVLLISLDTLRADGLSVYGNPRPTSPFLDQLAAQGTRFTHAFVATYGTTTSHASILSGQYQETHRVSFASDDGPQPRTAVPDHLPWLPTLLGEQGYHTLAVTDGGNVGGKFGFGRGFAVHDDRGGGIVRRVRRALEYLDQRPADRPFFLFLHTYEVHSPYTPPRDLRGRFGHPTGSIAPVNAELLKYHKDASKLPAEDLLFLRARYDEEIVAADRALARLFAQLEKRGLLANTLVVITSDHGEEFGEHGGLLHRGTLHEEMLHVPLLVLGPGLPQGKVDDQMVSSVDLAPSILSILGLPVPEVMHGHPRFGPQPAAPARFVIAQYGEARYAVRAREWKLIESRVGAGHVALYDLANDPRETVNRAAEQPELVAGMRREIAEFRTTYTPQELRPQREAQLSEEELRQLEALGYVDR